MRICPRFLLLALALLVAAGCQKTPTPVVIYCPETLYDTFVQVGESFYAVNGVPVVLGIIEEDTDERHVAGEKPTEGPHKDSARAAQKDETRKDASDTPSAAQKANSEDVEGDKEVFGVKGAPASGIATEILEKVELMHFVGNGDFWICDSPRQKDLLLSKAFVKETQRLGYARTVLYVRKDGGGGGPSRAGEKLSLDELDRRGGTLGVLADRGSGMGEAAAKVLQAWEKAQGDREEGKGLQVLEFATFTELFAALGDNRVDAVIAWDYLEQSLAEQAVRINLAENEAQTVVIELLVLTGTVEMEMPTKFRRFLSSRKAREIFKENGLTLY